MKKRGKNSKKRLLLFSIIVLLLVVSFVINFYGEEKAPILLADLTDEEKIDKAYACVEDQVYGKCSSLSSEERVFALLAIEKCENEVKSDSKYKSDIKYTSQAILGLDQVYVDVDDAVNWLLTQNSVPTDLYWFLQVENPDGETSCTIYYSGSSYNVVIGEDRKVKSGAGPCLSMSDNSYWFMISSSCYNTEFEITCNNRFSTNLLYKEKDSSTIFVSSETHGASADGSTYETVDSVCFGASGCNYEASLWAALALDSIGEDVSNYLPYLIASKEGNEKYLPEAFLYYLTGDFRADLLAMQKRDKYWDESGDKFYDTALAMFVLSDEPAEKTNAKNWLLDDSVQGSDGCWGNLRNTEFVLDAAWPDFWNYVDECRSDSDCDSEEVCVENSCVYVECKINDDCASDEVCIDNECIYQECVIDSDCASDEVCIDNECIYQECVSDDDCASDEVCIDNECIYQECESDDDCESNEICVDGVCDYQGPYPECITSDDCASDEVCIDGDCAYRECVISDDCNFDEVCIDNQCIYKECSVDGDCNFDEVCIGNQCTFQECETDEDCFYDEICVDGSCEYQECETNDDCASDEVCIDGDCAYGGGGIDCEWDFMGYCISSIDCEDAGGTVYNYECSSPFVCCDKDREEETCSDLGGEICESDEICSGGSFISTYDLDWGQDCCVEGTCAEGVSGYDCGDYGGTCKSSCDYDEKVDYSYDCEYGYDCCFYEGGGGSGCINDYDCSEGEVCEDGDCVNEGSVWWIWVLVILIILAVVGIIFKDKLRRFLIRVKTKGNKEPPRFPHRPGRLPPQSRRVPLRRPMPRRIFPPPQTTQQKRMLIRRPGPPPTAKSGPKPATKPTEKPKPKREVDEVLKKLKEIGK